MVAEAEGIARRLGARPLLRELERLRAVTSAGRAGPAAAASDEVPAGVSFAI